MRAGRAVAGVLCVGLVAGCAASERPDSGGAPTSSVPSTPSRLWPAGR